MIVVLLVIDQGAFGLRDDELPGRSSILATLGARIGLEWLTNLGFNALNFGLNAWIALLTTVTSLIVIRDAFAPSHTIFKFKLWY